MNRADEHRHHHVTPDYNRAFLLGVVLNVAFVVVEAIAGLMANSLALHPFPTHLLQLMSGRSH